MASLPFPSVALRNRHSSLALRLRSLLRRSRYAAVTIIVLVVIAMNFYSPVAHISIPRNTSSGLGKAVVSVQKEAYSLANGRRPTCHQTSWHQKRYASLHSTTASRTTNVFLAINFHNNEEVLPTFFQELPQLLRHVGPHQVFVSVYENGSDDKTPELLKLLGDLLTALGTPHKIVSRGQQEKSDKGDGNRINVLAAARNAALEPLYSGDAAKLVHGGLFHEMLFMNDIHFCAVDILEVLYQKRSQGANQACAMDWGGKVVYDRWIIRTMLGRTFYRYEELVEYFNGPDPPPGQSKTVPQLLPYDEAERIRMDEHLPLQVFSCWNGATAIDAAAFSHPHNIRFRTAKNDLDEHGKVKEVTEKASECFLVSVDLWKANMGKILVVPKASVAYGLDDYNYYRKDGPLSKKHAAAREKVTWKKTPPKEIAFQDYAAWYIPERWGSWDEP